MLDKELIKQSLLNHLTNKIDELNRLQRDLGQASANKSSVGDKHETEQAQKHLEQEKLGQQLSILEKYVQLTQHLHTAITDTIQFGSLFELERQFYYVSVGIGLIHVNDQSVFCIGLQAPIIQALRGKKQYDEIAWQGRMVKVNRII